MKLKIIIIISILVLLISFSEAFSQSFNQSTDLLLANFDLCADEDDVMAAAALACMLRHPDFTGVNYYAVAGAYGIQDSPFITAAVPDYFNHLFGAENTNWTNADGNWSASVTRVKNKVKTILNAGGKVFIQEAGQSDFSYDVLQAVIADGVSLSTVQANVNLVQHAGWNQSMTTPSKLDWVQDNTVYTKIPHANAAGNGTPGYKSYTTSHLAQARSAGNPNAAARTIWTLADDLCQDWTLSGNSAIEAGGVDFSDCVENWYIFNLGDDFNTGDEDDDIAAFWSRYVTNENEVDNDPPTPNPAQWQTPPHAVDDNTITMTAEAGTDTDSPPVEYYFTVTSGDCLSADSGWQTDPTYTLGGLAAGRQYCFTVKMQDQSGNETTPSEELCTTTTGVLDIVPPSPAPDFELAPVAVNSNEITMLATLTTDDNGPVEYYFTETSGNPGGSDSGWQTSREYTDTGLSGGHDYTYTVTARDAVCNETAASGPESAFTPIPQVTELTFAPTNDAYLQGTTLYNNTQLKVEPDYRVSYLMFDVTGIPANYDVTGATITLTENGDTGTGTLNFYLGSHNDWTETTLSSGTAPSTSVLVGVRSGVVSGGQTITVNVDSLVTGNGIVTLIIQMETGGNDIWFGSKESGAAGPVLTVTAESSGPAGYCGDLTLDGKVNLEDYAALAAGWPSVYTLADLFHVANDWLAGTAPYSLWFDGLDDYMEIPGYNGISGSQPRTVSAWVKTNPLATNQTIIQWGTDATGQLWLFYILSDGKLALAGYGGGVMSNAVVADGQWHHVAAVLEDGQNTSDAVKLYVDRQLDAVPFAGVCTLNTTADQPLHIGVWNRPVAADKIFYFLGHIDDVRIYDRALSAVEIGSIATTEDGLVAHWDLNEGSGDIARDYVSGYTGTIYGAQWVPE